MKPARRACWRCALLLLPLVAAGCARSLLRDDDAAVDQREVFWPVRPAYVERAKMQQAQYGRIIAPGESPKKLADGFTFTEGPTWLKGKLYFSDMWFKNPAAGDWAGSPTRSRLIVMEPDGGTGCLHTGCSRTAPSLRGRGT